MNLVIFQLPSLDLEGGRLFSYFKAIKEDSIVVFGEYVLNGFFRDLKNKSKKDIVQFSQKKLAQLNKIAKEFHLSIVVPILVGDEKKLYKKIAILNGNKLDFYTQQKLIPYSHWDEEAFFSNPKLKDFELPYIFKKNGFKIAVLSGFELHFDEIWLKMKYAGVDIVLLSTACTFKSNQRWRDLCKARAFFNSCVILRANKIGKTIQDGYEWKFYGDSFVTLPSGRILDCLGDQEEVLCVEIEKSQIDYFVKEWKFRGK